MQDWRLLVQFVQDPHENLPARIAASQKPQTVPEGLRRRTAWLQTQLEKLGDAEAAYYGVYESVLPEEPPQNFEELLTVATAETSTWDTLGLT